MCRLIMLTLCAQGIDKLQKLRVLSIQSNRITKLENLEALENLEELYISHNGLTKIEGLESNRNLTTLDIAGNRIRDVENVNHLDKMEEFWVSEPLVMMTRTKAESCATNRRMTMIFKISTGSTSSWVRITCHRFQRYTLKEIPPIEKKVQHTDES